MGRKNLVLLGISFFMSLFFINSAFAIPTFARKYRTSCNTCHIAIPKLTAFGESYRLNGYQIPEGDAAYVKEEPVSLGAPAWKRVWPEAVWPGMIPGPVPLSVRIISDFKVNQASEAASTDFNFPHEIELMMAGLLDENLPFFAEIEFEKETSSSSVETDVEAWLGFYNLFSNALPERALNLKVGTLGINPLPMANDHLRIGKNHYLYNDWRLSSASSGANGFRLRDHRGGLELNGILADRFWYGGGVVNGVNSTDKDGYIITRYKFGGTPFSKSAPGGGTEEAIKGKASGFWVDNALELASFGYFGSTEIGAAATANQEDDKFWRAGFALRNTYQNFDLNAGYIWGNNDDPYGSSSAQNINSQSWFVETNYVFKPWLIGELRYEALDVDMPTDFTVTNLDRARWVPGLIFQIRPNIKLVAEALIYSKYKVASDRQNNFVARLDANF
ncbi:MAG: hypothetical protein AABY28_05445 [Candidatus Omnitrophota bacterium]